MSRRHRTAFDFVQVNDLKAISASGIVIGPLGCAQRRSQSEAPDSSHAIDADSHAASAINASAYHSTCRLTSK
ncbi:MAG TPA: hypothetical protein VGN91_02935 [Bosea sp. (in: a-proteobacteria)]|nr:hypothetical protein [Bosea sp. (in: a-proteobacteria)]